MKKIIIFILALSLMLSIGNSAFAEEMVPTTKLNSIHAPIEAFISNEYNCIANLIVPTPKLSAKMESTKAQEFAAIENIMLTERVANLKRDGNDNAYSNYNLSTEYKDVFVSENYAKVEASVVCTFNYIDSPNIESQTGKIYEFELQKGVNGNWEIVDRANTTICDEAFWGGETRSLQRAEQIASKPILDNISKEYAVDHTIAPMAQVTGFDRNGAYTTALTYAPPDSTTWTSGTGYTYSYPKGYSQATLDCTNYVSFCLNYGGGIPQDNSGSNKWTPGISNWNNVDSFQSYVLKTKTTSEKGITATKIYEGSGSSYPSTTICNKMQAGDVAQFSSVGADDWTHTAIITRVTSGEVYVCMHDAYSWTNNVKLSSFYAGEYPTNKPRHIMLINITGYYS